MEQNNRIPNEYFRQLSIVHISLVIGLVFFAGIVAVIVTNGIFESMGDDIRTILLILVPVLTISAVLISIFLFRSRLNIIKTLSPGDKLEKYRSLLITRYALLEGPAFLAIVSSMLTADILFLAFAAVMIVLMAFWKPSKTAMANDLEMYVP